MGLIKAAVGALTGTLGDTWKEAIHCPVIGNDTVVVNGEKMHNGNARSSNTKGTDNVISNSIVADNRAVNGLFPGIAEDRKSVV